MSTRRWTAFSLLALPALLIATIPAHASVQFQPVSPDELKMTSEPKAPGAPAIILYREVNRNDYGMTSHGGGRLEGSFANRFEENYFRIKILTEEGRKYANVEIPLVKETGEITGITARTIRPDGSIVNFDGKVYDKTIVKKKGSYQYVAKTFLLPDVQVGSIIEYYYTLTFKEGYIFFSDWILSNELFTKRAKFTLKPFHPDYGGFSFRWNEHLPSGTPSPVQGPDEIVRLEVTDIEAFRAEDFMPPENELKARVDFIYSSDSFESDPAKFWKKIGKQRNEQVESFISRHGALEQAVSQIVAPTDSPEVKLRKLYARVQQLRNTTYETRKSEQEEKREKRKNDENAEDIWKQGYGADYQLNRLFLGLARTAGVEASAVAVSDRGSYFFNAQSMQSAKLDRTVVVVKVDGKDVFCEPGTPYTPFGLLRWEETGVPGLRLDKDGGSWVQTSAPTSATSQIERKAELTLSDSGVLEGKLTLTFTGLEALQRRLDERNEDEAARKKYLEDEVQHYIPVAGDIDLIKPPDWTSSELPLVAEFKLKITGWASPSGKRALFPIGIFGATEKHVFDYSNRVHPIYFNFLSQELDDVTIELPSGWQIANLPQPQNKDLHAVAFSAAAENANSALHLKRKVDINVTVIDIKYYASLRGFFQIIRASDEQPVILEMGTPTAAN